jgi:hypothetical protein
MEKVFIVVVYYTTAPENAIMRVFANYDRAIVYGEDLILEGIITDFDIYEREVY